MGKGNRLQKFKYAQISIFVKWYFISFSWEQGKADLSSEIFAFPWKNYFENWLSSSHIHSISTVYFSKNLSELIKYIQKNDKLENIGKTVQMFLSFFHLKKSCNIMTMIWQRKKTFHCGKVRILRYSGQIKIVIYLPVIWGDIAMVTS